MVGSLAVVALPMVAATVVESQDWGCSLARACTGSVGQLCCIRGATELATEGQLAAGVEREGPPAMGAQLSPEWCL